MRKFLFVLFMIFGLAFLTSCVKENKKNEPIPNK